MLKRFSISNIGGIEIYAFDPKEGHGLQIDPQLISGFMEAMQMMSESMGTALREIKFSDMILYVKTYGDFTIRVLVDERMEESEISSLFDRASRATLLILAEHPGVQFIEKRAFKVKLLPILEPMTRSAWKGSISLLRELELQSNKDSFISKIGLFGLGKAGKTSIKNMFFDKWTKEMVQTVKPTVGAEITNNFIDFLEESFTIVDFGGQSLFREEHFENEYLWNELSTIIYVIDVQSPDMFVESKNYLDRIIEYREKISKKKAKLAILLHKYDLNKRDELSSNLTDCLKIYSDYANVGTFFLTTIEDESSTIALIKTIYLSLPAVMLKRLLEEEFLDHFYEKVLPIFNDLIKRKEVDILSKDFENEIYNNAIIIGKDYGRTLQKKWIESLMGRLTPKERALSSKLLKVEQQKQFLLITIEIEEAEESYKNIITKLLEGILTGIMKTFYLAEPTIVEKLGKLVTWKVEI